jgi:uncharacterized Zn finger protein (UPF0148 family)
VKYSSLASRPGSLVCPVCEAGQLRTVGHRTARCESCAGFLNGDMLETLRQVAALSHALGKHACECGHPEMRRLPDGTYHCPACGSEVLLVDADLTPSKFDEHSEAYLAGWMDGCLRERSSFVDNPNLAKWEDPSDRLTYYRGHRAGSEVRRKMTGVPSEISRRRMQSLTGRKEASS